MGALRVGVWGVGTWGEKHARVWRRLASQDPEIELVGVHDQSAERARAVAGSYECRSFESATALLGAVDAVTIATPTVAHRVAAEAALGAGCHVLVEKPLATTTAEADAMLAAATRAGRTLQVGHVERFNPVMMAARER